MSTIQVISLDEVEPNTLIGTSEKSAGWLKRIIYSPKVNAKAILLGMAEINPGHSPHRWHIHTTDKTETHETIYPDNFEEVYVILEGSGVVQWREDDDSIAEKRVKAGDSIFFPAGVPEHQLLNDGSSKMVIIYAGGPPVKIIPNK